VDRKHGWPYPLNIEAVSYFRRLRFVLNLRSLAICWMGSIGQWLGVRAVIGVGGTKPQPIPRFDLAGKKLGYWRAEDIAQVDAYSSGRFGTGETLSGVDISDLEERLKNGREHLSSLRGPWLQQLADEAGLDYKRLENASQTARFLTDTRWIIAAVSLVLIMLAYSIRPR